MSVDVARLRDLLKARREALHDLQSLAGSRPGGRWSTDDLASKRVRSDRCRDAVSAVAIAAAKSLPALLDELETARRLLTEVNERGLSSFGDAAQRIDLTRRVATFLES